MMSAAAARPAERNEQVSIDLSKHLQAEVFKVVERHLQTARLVLDPTQLSIVLIELGMATISSAVATTAANAKDKESAASITDILLSLVTNKIPGQREMLLARVDQKRGW